MIVKNEEVLLPQCLRSVEGFVDEIIVVDTGSTDKTVEIAESFGAKVYHHAWEGDFSKARNYSLDYATSEWILVLDADEELERKDIPVIKQALIPKQYDVIFCAILNENNEGWAKHYSQRFFRKGKAHYEGIVHNQVIYKSQHVMTEIRVYHYGYNLSEEKMIAKYKRTEALLLEQLEKDSTHPYTYLNYVRTLRAQRRYSDAVTQGKKALDICGKRLDEIFIQMIAYDTTYCMMMLKDYQEAEKMAKRILMKHPHNMDFLFTMGSIFIFQKRLEEAIAVYHQFLKAYEKAHQDTKGTRLIIDTYSFDHRVLGNIAECNLELGRLDEAEKAARKAIDTAPSFSIYRFGLARVLLRAGRGEEAKAVLIQAEEESKVTPDFYMKWLALSNLNQAWMPLRDVFHRALTRFPDSSDILNAFGCAAFANCVPDAEKAWRLAIEKNPEHLGAHSGLAKVYAQTGRTAEFLAETDYILQHTQSQELLRESAGNCVTVGQYAKAIDLFVKLLDQNPGDVDVLCDIATCYAKLGKLESAIIGYQAVLGMSPGNERALKNLEALLRLPSANKPS
jgi:tetratricopeptide (TPR) repeat protein